MMNPEWKEYTGSDEQIAEISHCQTNILLMYSNGTERFKSSMSIGAGMGDIKMNNYLLSIRMFTLVDAPAMLY